MSTQKNNANKETDLNTEDLSEVTNSVGGASDAVVLNDDEMEDDYLPSGLPDKGTFTHFYQTYERPMMPYPAIQQQVVNGSGNQEAIKVMASSVFDRHYAPLVGPLTRVTAVIKANFTATKKELRRVSGELANTPQFISTGVEKAPFTTGDWVLLVIPSAILVFLAVLSPFTMAAHFQASQQPIFTNHLFLTYGLGLFILLAGTTLEVGLQMTISQRFKRLVLALTVIGFAFSLGDFLLSLGSITSKNGLTAIEKIRASISQSPDSNSNGNLTQKWMIVEIATAALSFSCVVMMLNKRYHSRKNKNPHYGEVKKDLDKLHIQLQERANLLGSAEGRLESIQHERELFVAEAVTTYHYALRERA